MWLIGFIMAIFLVLISLGGLAYARHSSKISECFMGGVPDRNLFRLKMMFSTVVSG
jgi:hypothetical protein